MNNHIFMI